MRDEHEVDALHNRAERLQQRRVEVDVPSAVQEDCHPTHLYIRVTRRVGWLGGWVSRWVGGRVGGSCTHGESAEGSWVDSLGVVNRCGTRPVFNYSKLHVGIRALHIFGGCI